MPNASVVASLVYEHAPRRTGAEGSRHLRTALYSTQRLLELGALLRVRAPVVVPGPSRLPPASSHLSKPLRSFVTASIFILTRRYFVRPDLHLRQFESTHFFPLPPAIALPYQFMLEHVPFATYVANPMAFGPFSGPYLSRYSS